MATPPSLTLNDLGGKQSLFGAKFVGLMRAGAATGAAATAMGLATLGLAHLESRFPTVRRYDVPVLDRQWDGEFRILHISDLHMFAGQEFISDFLRTVAETEQFDFVVSTGDNLSDESGVPLLLDALQPLFEYPGAFVLGSNDYYLPKRKKWTAYLDPTHHTEAAGESNGKTPNLPWLGVVKRSVEAGWIDMSNRTETITLPTGDGPKTISMVGVDDPHILRDRFPQPDDQWDKPDAVRLTLTHSPYRRILDQATILDSDLILAGHTHGGQVRLPGVGAIVNNCDIPTRYSRGLYQWKVGDHESWLNISAGLGTSRYAQIRFFCRPEVSILRLYSAE